MPMERILAPEWKPIVWREEERRKAKPGLEDDRVLHTYGTPQVGE
jgi:hypothetical protein